MASKKLLRSDFRWHPDTPREQRWPGFGKAAGTSLPKFVRYVPGHTALSPDALKTVLGRRCRVLAVGHEGFRPVIHVRRIPRRAESGHAVALFYVHRDPRFYRRPKAYFWHITRSERYPVGSEVVLPPVMWLPRGTRGTVKAVGREGSRMTVHVAVA